MKQVNKLLAALFSAFAVTAFAGESTTDVVITGSVVGSCTISAPSTVAFGSMPKDTVKTETFNITVNCGSGVAYTIKPHNASTISVGGTKNGTNFNITPSITGQSSFSVEIGVVNLYRDTAATQAWSDQAGEQISGTGTGANQNHGVAVKFTHDGTNYGNFSATLRPTVTF